MSDNTATVNTKTWLQELGEKFGSSIAHAFILHGNIEDYVGNDATKTLRAYLAKSFSATNKTTNKANFDIVVFYSRAGGFWFASPQMETLFVEITGLAEATRGMSADAKKMLNQIGSQSVSSLNLLSKALAYQNSEKKVRIAVILEHSHTLAPNCDPSNTPESDRTCISILNDWGRDLILGASDNIAHQRHLMIMVASNLSAVADSLRGSWEQLEIALPNYLERYEFVEMLSTDIDEDAADNDNNNDQTLTPTATTTVDRNDTESDKNLTPKIAALAPGVSIENIARLTNGLPRLRIEDIFMQAKFKNQLVDLPLAKKRKDELVQAEYGEVLKIVDAEEGFESLGGLSIIKDFLLENVIIPMRNGVFSAVPMGILLMGPAGTGKSKIARALSKEAGVTFVELQPGKIFSKWVGETERNLEKCLNAIRSMSPCIVFIDELEQALKRGEGQSGDSGVSDRFFKRLIEFMADTSLRGKVLFIGATNRPELLDAALKRAGRFDIKVPILAPNAQERLDILYVQATKNFGLQPSSSSSSPSASSLGTAGKNTATQALALLTKEQLIPIADDMESYTGAEIEAVIVKALRLWHKSRVNTNHPTPNPKPKKGELSVLEAISEAHSLTLPTTSDVALMTRLALENCSDLELVPPEYRAEVRRLRLKSDASKMSLNPSETELDTGSRKQAVASRNKRGKKNEEDTLDLFT